MNRTLSKDSEVSTVSPPLRILEVETFGRGGLIHYAYNLSCALAQRGHEITLVTAAAYELEERPLPSKVRVIKAIARVTPRMGRKWPAFATSLARKFETIFDACAVTMLARKLRPDVIHLHCTNPASLLYHLLFRLLRIPFVATAHVVTPHEGIRYQDLIYRRIHQACHLVIAHSKFDRQRLLQEFDVDPARAVVIPHGEYGFFDDANLEGEELLDRAQARASLGLEDHHEVALFFGYIREYKGLDLLLEAWSTVQGERPEARLVIAGDPVQLSTERREELKAWANRVGAVHRFEYIPFSEVSRYFAVADLLVMPYRHISQSGVLFLALSLGVPVVATKVGALPEVLRHEESAMLVPTESPPALAQALVQVLGDPKMRERLSQGGRQVADEHSWSSIAGRTESAFSQLVSPQGDQRGSS